MKIGMRGHDFGRKNIIEFFSFIKECGFDCVQLAPAKAIEGINSFTEITPQHMEEIQKQKELTKVDITVLGC